LKRKEDKDHQQDRRLKLTQTNGHLNYVRGDGGKGKVTAPRTFDLSSNMNRMALAISRRKGSSLNLSPARSKADSHFRVDLSASLFLLGA